MNRKKPDRFSETITLHVHVAAEALRDGRPNF
jgi:hypothetical protein